MRLDAALAPHVSPETHGRLTPSSLVAQSPPTACTPLSGRFPFPLYRLSFFLHPPSDSVREPPPVLGPLRPECSFDLWRIHSPVVSSFRFLFRFVERSTFYRPFIVDLSESPYFCRTNLSLLSTLCLRALSFQAVVFQLPERNDLAPIQYSWRG